jgi:ribosomal protein S18 acetylase RimI-like enzyme
MGVHIRRATLSDVEGVVAFASAVVPSHYTPILGADAAQAQLAWWTPQRMASAVEAGRVHIAVTGVAVVGVCETGEMDSEQVIWKLYLRPEFRGRSIGVKLLRAAIAALPNDCQAVLVEHFAGNARAGSFYEREGFQLVKTEPAGTGDPNAAIVWRRLDLSG